MSVTIRPIAREDGAACADWTARVAALPLDQPDAWTGDTYRAFFALIEEAFTSLNVTHLVGSCGREDGALVAFWQSVADQRQHNQRRLVNSSGWWFDDTHGAQRLRWEWVRWPLGQEPTA